MFVLLCFVGGSSQSSSSGQSAPSSSDQSNYSSDPPKPHGMTSSKGHVTFAKPLENSVRGSSTTSFRGDPKYASDRRQYAGTIHSVPVRGVIKDPRDSVARRPQYSTFMDPRHHGNPSANYGNLPVSATPPGYNPNASHYGSFKSLQNNPNAARADPRTYTSRTRNYGGNSPRDYGSPGDAHPKPMQYRHMQNDPAREYVLKLEGTDISNDVMV